MFFPSSMCDLTSRFTTSTGNPYLGRAFLWDRYPINCFFSIVSTVFLNIFASVYFCSDFAFSSDSLRDAKSDSISDTIFVITPCSLYSSFAHFQLLIPISSCSASGTTSISIFSSSCGFSSRYFSNNSGPYIPELQKKSLTSLK